MARRLLLSIQTFAWLGSSRSHPGSKGVPSDSLSALFTGFQAHPVPEVEAIPARPSCCLGPEMSFRDGERERERERERTKKVRGEKEREREREGGGERERERESERER